MSDTAAADHDRLNALLSYDILDTPSELGYDDIVQLATQICETPVALISLVAAERQWFKARIGFEPCETPLDQSVCAHALDQRDLMVIPDLTLDARTKDNPLVTGHPHMRFYAGAVLVTQQGHALGTLCVIDSKPRPQGLTDPQRSGLEALARQVMAQLALRRALTSETAALAAARLVESKLRFALKAGRLGSWSHDIGQDDRDGRGILALGDTDAQIHPEDLPTLNTDITHALRDDLDLDKEYRVLRSNGTIGWVNLRGRLERGPDGLAIRIAGIAIDITSRKEAEQHRQMLMEELSHRVKNTFSLVQAIASQTLRRVDSEAAEAFKSRIVALSQAHDVLLQDDWAAASLDTIIDGVLSRQIEEGRFGRHGVDLTVGPKAALSLSLLLHELATNAVKYGALSVPEGRIDLHWHVTEEAFTLSWRETGGPAASPPQRRGFGSRLIGLGIAGAQDVTLDYGGEGLLAVFRAPLALLHED